MLDKFFAAEINEDAVSIDLHNFQNIYDALEHLERELFYFAQEKESYCRVIHGIGTGAMARAVGEALGANPLVVGWKVELHGGSTIALF